MKDRICKSLRLMSLGFTILSASWVQAQEVLVSLEAEDGIITLPAKVKPTNGTTVAGLSGGKYVGDNDPGSSIVFTNVEVPETGTYEFKTYYMSMQNRSIAIKVNNYSEFISTVTNTTPGWDNPPTNTMSTYIYMDKGMNTITITPQGSGGPNLDKFEIITTDVELPTPGEFPILLEAETAQLFGNLKVKPVDGSSIAGLSGGKYIGDFDLEYLLNKSGTIRLKAYNHYNDQNYYIKSALTTQGVGIMLRHDFSLWSDLFKRSPRPEAAVDSVRTTPPSTQPETPADSTRTVRPETPTLPADSTRVVSRQPALKPDEPKEE